MIRLHMLGQQLAQMTQSAMFFAEMRIVMTPRRQTSSSIRDGESCVSR
jgi:hypothetical protein